MGDNSRRTIVIDVENTLVTKLEVNDLGEIDKMRKLENFNKDYIFIQGEGANESPIVYMVRPYTLDILRALQPFYELIAFSNIPERVLNAIIKHIEVVLY